MRGGEIDELLAEAALLPYGPERMSKNEEAVRAADRLGDPDLQWDARMELVTTATFGGFIERALVAFGWCASACDRDPERFPESTAEGGLFLRGADLLWAYKWIVQNMVLFAGISRKQIDESLAEMERRYVRNGLSLRPVHIQRARVAMAMGDDADFTTAHASFLSSKRDVYADCAACEAHFEVEAALHNEDVDRAVHLFDEMIRTEMSCAEVPHITYADLIHPLHRKGDIRAAHFCKRAESLCGDNRDFIPQLMDIIDFHRVTGKPDRAAALVARYAPWAAESRIDERIMRFLVTAEQTLQVFDGPIHMPRELDIPNGSSNAEAAQILGDRVDDFAARFDTRNGNSHVSESVAELRSRG